MRLKRQKSSLISAGHGNNDPKITAWLGLVQVKTFGVPLAPGVVPAAPLG